MIVFTGSGAVLNIVVNIILLPKLYIWGAAIATLVSYFTMAFTIYIISNKIYPIRIEWKPILKMISLMGLMFFLFYQFDLNILARSLMGIFALFYAYIFVLGSRERGFIKNKILKFGSAASE